MGEIGQLSEERESFLELSGPQNVTFSKIWPVNVNPGSKNRRGHICVLFFLLMQIIQKVKMLDNKEWITIKTKLQVTLDTLNFLENFVSFTQTEMK